MKTSKTLLLQSAVAIMPLIYLVSVWHNLPETVPLHYNTNMEPDDFGSKLELAGLLLFMVAVSIGLSALILNIHKFDPKKKYDGNNPLMHKISWACTLFLCIISFFIVYETENYALKRESYFSPKYIVALTALIFVVLGNLMNNIKPNYFIGIRTPWALDDEDNWRKTHHLSSKLWFFCGLLMFVLVLILPETLSHYVIIGSLIPMVIIPIWYSYHLFKQKQKT